MHNPVSDLLRVKPRHVVSWMTFIRRGTFHYPTYRKMSHVNHGTFLNVLDYAGQLPYLKVVTLPIGICIVANLFSGLLIYTLAHQQMVKLKRREGKKNVIG